MALDPRPIRATLGDMFSFRARTGVIVLLLLILLLCVYISRSDAKSTPYYRVVPKGTKGTLAEDCRVNDHDEPVKPCIFQLEAGYHTEVRH